MVKFIKITLYDFMKFIKKQYFIKITMCLSFEKFTTISSYRDSK